MLDTQQIKISTKHTQSVLKHIKKIDGVHLVTGFFDQDLLDKLLEYCQTTTSWQPIYNLKQKEIECRKKIAWEDDSVVEVVHTVLQNVTPQLESIFNKQLKFNGIDLWKDTKGYTINRHTDNPIFNVSLQIYIDNLPHLVTVFEHEFVFGYFATPGISNDAEWLPVCKVSWSNILIAEVPKTRNHAMGCKRFLYIRWI